LSADDLVAALHPGGEGAAQIEKLAHGRGLVLLFVPDEVELPRQVQVRVSTGTRLPRRKASRSARREMQPIPRPDSTRA
jgi:hypothetical protein